MKVRVYDSAAGNKEKSKYKDYIDRYSLYFPLPKKDIQYYDGGRITGYYLGFSFNEDGTTINRCIWDEWNTKYGLCDCLGKKVKIETLPQKVQDWIHGYEKVYNESLKYPDDNGKQKAWNDYF